jgi:hypothetical protein
LACDEGGATGRATLLPVPVRETPAFGRNAVNVRRAIAHDALVITTRVEPADIVTPDDENVWFASLIWHISSSFAV